MNTNSVRNKRVLAFRGLLGTWYVVMLVVAVGMGLFAAGPLLPPTDRPDPESSVRDLAMELFIALYAPVISVLAYMFASESGRLKTMLPISRTVATNLVWVLAMVAVPVLLTLVFTVRGVAAVGVSSGGDVAGRVAMAALSVSGLAATWAVVFAVRGALRTVVGLMVLPVTGWLVYMIRPFSTAPADWGVAHALWCAACIGAVAVSFRLRDQSLTRPMDDPYSRRNRWVLGRSNRIPRRRNRWLTNPAIPFVLFPGVLLAIDQYWMSIVALVVLPTMGLYLHTFSYGLHTRVVRKLPLSTRQFVAYMATPVIVAHVVCAVVATALLPFTPLHEYVVRLGLVAYSFGLALVALPSLLIVAARLVQQSAPVRMTFLFLSLSSFFVLAVAPGFLYLANPANFVLASFTMGIIGTLLGHALTLRAIRSGAILMRLRER